MNIEKIKKIARKIIKAKTNRKEPPYMIGDVFRHFHGENRLKEFVIKAENGLYEILDNTGKATGKKVKIKKDDLNEASHGYMKKLENWWSIQKSKKGKQTVFTQDDPDSKNQTYQKQFKETCPCEHCGEEARRAFIMKEEWAEDAGKFISDKFPNELSSGGSFWPHDAISVAVYFCTKCAKPTTLWNQA